MDEIESYLLDDVDDYYDDEYVKELDALLDINVSPTMIPSSSDSGSSSGDKRALIISNLDFVRSHMGNVLNRSSEYMDYCNQRHDVDSTKVDNKLYDKFNRVMDAYYGTQAVLMEKLHKEAEFIVKTAEMYDELDKQLKAKVGGQ